MEVERIKQEMVNDEDFGALLILENSDDIIDTLETELIEVDPTTVAFADDEESFISTIKEEIMDISEIKREEGEIGMREDIEIVAELSNGAISLEEDCFECVVCERKIYKFDELNLHLEKHRNLCDIPCKQCSATLQDFGCVKSHTEQHNADMYNRTCSDCAKTFSTELQLQEHVCKLPHTCQVCHQSFLYLSELTFHDCSSCNVDIEKYNCLHCERDFIKKPDLEVHILEHLKNLQVACSHCPRTFSSMRCLKLHTRSHKGKKIRCPKCPRIFLRNHHLRLHLRSHLSNKSYVCEFCQKRCISSNELLIHMRRHTGEKPFTCPSCEKRFYSNNALLCHMRSHEDKLFINMNFSNENAAIEAATNVHNLRKRRQSDVEKVNNNEEEPFSCCECQTHFSSHVELLLHQKTHSDISESNTFSCLFCPKIFSQKVRFEKHMIHKHQQSLRCSYCSFTCTQEGDLEQHISLLHNHPIIETGMKIQSTSAQVSGIPEHIQTITTSTLVQHVRPNNSICGLCGRSFDNQEEYEDHICDERKHSCPICPGRFRFKRTLAKHLLSHQVVNNIADIKPDPLYTQLNGETKSETQNESTVHTGESSELFLKESDTDKNGNEVDEHEENSSKCRYSCGYCKKKFSRINLLRLHVRAHILKRPYWCAYCEKQFCDTHSLMTHVRIHYFKNSPMCSLCQRQFPSSAELKTHVRQFHKSSLGGIREQNEDTSIGRNETHTVTLNPFAFSKRKKRFTCNYCQKVFHNEERWNTHRISHMNRRQYTCSFCQKKFAFAHYLKLHLRKHTAGKKLHCSYCTRTFSYSFHLKKHTLNHKLQGDQMLNVPNDIQECDSVTLTKQLNIQEDKIKEDQMPNRTVKTEILFNCSYCSKKYTTEAALEFHIHLHKTNQIVDLDPPNPEVQNTFEFKPDLQGNSCVSKRGKIRFTCEHCPKKFKSQNLLDLHKRRHNKHKHVCRYCQKTFTHSNYLQLHLRKHTLPKKRCNYCAKTFSYEHYFINHLMMHQTKGDKEVNIPENEPNNDLIKSEISSENSLQLSNSNVTQAASKLSVINDLDKVHQQPKLLLVDDKESSNRLTGGVNDSLTGNDLNSTMRNIDQSFYCEFCPKYFSSEAILNIHKERHMTKKTHSCDHCYKTFSNAKALHHHSLAHKNKKLHCPYCPKIFSYNFCFKKHVLSHKAMGHQILQTSSGDFHIQDVTEVKQEFKSVENFENKTEITTTAEDTFPCTKCDKTFPAVKYLTLHSKVHSEDNISCFECGQLFRTKYLLQKHKLIHQAKKQTFKCSLCEKHFGFSNHLMWHQMKIHGITPPDKSNQNVTKEEQVIKTEFSCELCPKKFVTEHRLLCHKAKRHAYCPPDNLKNESDTTTRSLLVKDETNELSDRFKCPTCQLGFHYKSRLLAHRCKLNKTSESGESQEQVFPTDTCVNLDNMGFSDQNVKKIELQDESKLSSLSKKSVKTLIKCEFCTKQFSNPDLYVVHKQRHLRKKQLTEEYLKTVNPKPKKLNCPYCTRTFSYTASWKNHITSHEVNGDQKLKSTFFTKSNEVQEKNPDFTGQPTVQSKN